MILLIFLLFCFFWPVSTLETGQNEIRLGKLKFENGECRCFEFNAQAAKTYEEKRINQYRSVQAKGLKKRFKNNILQNDLKDTTLYVKPVRITEKQIKSSNLDNGRCRKRCYSSSFEWNKIIFVIKYFISMEL